MTQSEFGHVPEAGADPLGLALLQALPNATILVDASGAAGASNARWIGLRLGAVPRDIRGWRPLLRAAVDPREVVRALRNANWAVENYRIALKDGRWLNLIITPFEVAGEPLWAWFIRELDVVSSQTAANLVMAERRAVAMEQRLLAAFESLGAAVQIYDADERLVLINDLCAALYPENAAILKPGLLVEDFWRSIGRVARPGIAAAELEAFAAERAAEFRAARGEREVPSIDGRVLRLTNRRTSTGDTVVLRVDITELKRREAALKQAEENQRISRDRAEAAEAEARRAHQQLEDAIASVPDGFLLYDKDSRLVIYNDRVRELYGEDFRLRVGMSSAEWGLEVIRTGNTLSTPDEVHGRRPFPGQETTDWEDQLANGHWVRVSRRRMRDGGRVSIRTDITEAKQREEQLQAALLGAMAASKAKSDFLANMSHELRTPLNAIIGFSEMIQAELFGPVGSERYSGYVDDIHSSGEHLLGIINTVLDLARVEAGKVLLEEAEVDLAEAIDSCITLLRDRAAQGEVTLLRTVPAGVPRLRADPMRLRQVIINLMSNAVKFTGPGGSVTVRVEVGGPHGGVSIMVEDTGIGMAPEDVPLAFEPFGVGRSEHSRAHEGTGLGLPLSKAMIEQHGGTLALTSILGLGTTATVWLPPDRMLN